MEKIQALEEQSLAIPTQAQSIVVASSADMERADKFNQDVKAMVKQVDDVFKPLADKASQAHRAITGKWNEIKKPLVEAQEIITRKVRAYIQEEKRKAEEEEARLREEARKLEEERRLAEAVELEKEGRKEEAQAVIEEPMQIVTPTVKADVPKYDARTYRPPIKKVKIVNMGKFLQWVVQSSDRYEYVTVNERPLNAKAKSLGDAFNVPGTEIYEE